ncbi:c-type cytochrome [Aurantimonas endophytica]|uniref:Thiosulfate dehydrogenase n=1 Tax=Aurantimonas endophytica TaxID=1522175 RepID=A0A7W6H9Z8_9HYPH|nr:c-type cytochrome [Aurantimonas endophytica]MBB4001298.1 thiosulfate dehydrogenase [Aurantimonas endophytica]MCO6403058.1 c-type cytochrome [Aurantimonas endophytica]
MRTRVGAAVLFVALAAVVAVLAGRSWLHPDNGSMADGDALVSHGRDIFRQTKRYAAAYVGNDLSCSNCHIDAGRHAGAAPISAAYPHFPAYSARDKRDITFGERLQECFEFSLNGVAPPADGDVVTALTAYARRLSENAVREAVVLTRGFPELDAAPLPPSPARGAVVYANRCSICHGADGGGQGAEGTVVFPPLWGEKSYNAGAGMARTGTAAAFVAANMPLGQGGTLPPQDAWDVGAFINSQTRPPAPQERTQRMLAQEPTSSSHGR